MQGANFIKESKLKVGNCVPSERLQLVDSQESIRLWGTLSPTISLCSAASTASHLAVTTRFYLERPGSELDRPTLVSEETACIYAGTFAGPELDKPNLDSEEMACIYAGTFAGSALDRPTSCLTLVPTSSTTACS